ncbi:MAG: septum formation initiator family protein [Silvanigrellaceae bacterium]|nr:septum formation initiator family protein [Silvanigrellaceae bacterium]
MGKNTMGHEIFSLRFTFLSRWVIGIAAWLIIISMSMGKTGISNYFKLRQEKEVLIQSNIELMVANQQLQEKIEKLSHSQATRIKYLKQNFGYLEKNEYVYQFGYVPVIASKKRRLLEQESSAQLSKANLETHF